MSHRLNMGCHSGETMLGGFKQRDRHFRPVVCPIQHRRHNPAAQRAIACGLRGTDPVLYVVAKKVAREKKDNDLAITLEPSHLKPHAARFDPVHISRRLARIEK
ncbi:MAG: hypothetical protein IPO30_20410 [Hyphomonadaceae bacterium]|nr:hypothetical protein [Hyphomonadaceae bacterium]